MTRPSIFSRWHVVCHHDCDRALDCRSGVRPKRRPGRRNATNARAAQRTQSAERLVVTAQTPIPGANDGVDTMNPSVQVQGRLRRQHPERRAAAAYRRAVAAGRDCGAAWSTTWAR